jgi:hypothetical protein
LLCAYTFVFELLNLCKKKVQQNEHLLIVFRKRFRVENFLVMVHF